MQFKSFGLANRQYSILGVPVLNISIIFNALLLLGVVYHYTKTYKEKKELTAQVPGQTHFKVILYGDSMTANWFLYQTVLKKYDFKISGNPGLTTSHLNLTYFIESEVLKYNPDTCYVMAGVNDVIVGIPLRRVFENYNSIIDTLKKHKIIPIIQSTLFTVNDSISNLSIDTLDKYLVKLSLLKHVKFIDLNKSMSVNKRLRSNLSVDGLHLNEEGYKIWANNIN